MTAPPLLSLEGIAKRYGAVTANADVAFDLARGEVLGILGENGAGKSTLVNILGGLARADAGTIRIEGRPVAIDSPRAAAALGIGMVHQHFMLVDALTVAESFALGDPRWGRATVDYTALRARIGTLAASLGMQVDFDARIGTLSVAAQQRVEILKALAREPRILILDEPTAVLAPADRAALVDTVIRLRDRGVATILISHKLEDIYDLCSRVVVMRQGRVVAVERVAGLAPAALVRLLVGEDVPAPARDAGRVAGTPVLEANGLRLARRDGTTALDDVSLTLRAGETLGIAGVDGNGQSELVRVLAGMARPDAGTLEYRFAGKVHRGPLGPGRLRRLGMAHIAEDRLRHAVVAALDLASNWLLTHLHAPGFTRLGWVCAAPARASVRGAIEAFAIKAPGAHVPLGALSGGNQQKLVIARELAPRPTIVIAAYPTRGLDVRTMAFVKAQLLAARERGSGVLLVSNDLAEVMEIADRIVVMNAGRALGPVPARDATVESLGAWMTAR